MQRAFLLLLLFVFATGAACTDRAGSSTGEEGPGATFILSIPNGASAAEIVQRLRSLGQATGDFDPDLVREGWPAPGEHVFAHGTARSEMVAGIIAMQQGRLSAVWDYRAPDLPLATPEALLILASLVEREAPAPEFFESVAAVFVNRLRRGMKLQSDAALIYGITRGEKARKRPLQQSDIRTDTPWNTYVRLGLPETPICSPSLEALAAASHPSQTGYLFFAPDAAGGLLFAETLEQHNANVAAFRQKSARSRAQDGQPD